MFRIQKHIIIILTFLMPILIKAQSISLGIGTDIPYQVYANVTFETKQVDISYKSGILTRPYSDAILNLFQALGTDEIYIKLLETSYDFGWMNTLGAYYKFGEKRKWYAGPELRFDYFTASETPSGILEEIAGDRFENGNQTTNIKGKLSVMTYAIGWRSGYKFELKQNNKHNFRIEISAAKYIATHATLKINGESNTNLNKYVDEQIWENMFKRNGVLIGFGVSYAYRFKK